jgi:hypothetical protein
MKLRLIIFALLVTALLTSCEKVIDIDLNESKPRLVVEGAITLSNGPFFVQLSTSGDFFTGEGIAPVSNATGYITTSYGDVDSLVNVGNGIYRTTKLIAIPNSLYTLHVNYDSQNYTASDSLPEMAYIDSVNYSISEFGHSGPPAGEVEYETYYDFYCYFDDPSNKTNFYILNLSVNGEAIDGHQGKFYVVSDEFFNGKHVSYLFFGVGAYPNDTVTISLSAVGKATYNYFRTLNDAISQGGMGSTPYNPISNVSNNALGYFGTFTFDSKTMIIRE